MGRRGPRSKLTDDMIERVKEQYRNGVAHRTIAAEVGISETNIRRIIGMHGIPKRGRKLATLLSPQEEDGLVRYLSTFGPFRGKYRTLRTAMEQFAQENNMKCTFTYSWRDGFVRRHRHRLPPHIIKLLSPKVQRDDDIDSDLDILDNNYGLPGEGPMKEPSVWKQKPKLSTQERALKETKKAFTKAGLSKEEVLELLIKLKVPGIMNELPPTQIQSDVVAAAINNVFGETSQEPGPSTVSHLPDSSDIVAAAARAAEVAAKAARKKERKTPMKKTPLQLEILEKAFIRSPTCGDKRAKKLGRMLGLTPSQVIYWFHNTARHKRKLTTQAIMLAEHVASQGLEGISVEGLGTDSNDGNLMDGISLEGTEVDTEAEGEQIIDGEELEGSTEEMETMDQDIEETEAETEHDGPTVEA